MRAARASQSGIAAAEGSEHVGARVMCGSLSQTGQRPRGMKGGRFRTEIDSQLPRVCTARATSRKVRYPFECKDPVTAEGPAQLTPERRALIVRASAAGRESKQTKNVAYYQLKTWTEHRVRGSQSSACSRSPATRRGRAFSILPAAHPLR
jgi:hypothetical protein